MYRMTEAQFRQLPPVLHIEPCDQWVGEDVILLPDPMECRVVGAAHAWQGSGGKSFDHVVVLVTSEDHLLAGRYCSLCVADRRDFLKEILRGRWRDTGMMVHGSQPAAQRVLDADGIPVDVSHAGRVWVMQPKAVEAFRAGPFGARQTPWRPA